MFSVTIVLAACFIMIIPSSMIGMGKSARLLVNFQWRISTKTFPAIALPAPPLEFLYFDGYVVLGATGRTLSLGNIVQYFRPRMIIPGSASEYGYIPRA